MTAYGSEPRQKGDKFFLPLLGEDERHKCIYGNASFVPWFAPLYLIEIQEVHGSRMVHPI